MLAHVRRALPHLTSIRDFYDLPREYYETHSPPPQRPATARILLLTATCNGFGDVVFACKLRRLLRKLFNAQVHIATNNVNNFLTVGERVENLVFLKTRARDPECRKFSTMKPYKAFAERSSRRLVPQPIDDYDLYFVAPLVLDFVPPSYRDVRALIPTSNRFNTFFFSEYNTPLSPDILFPTGVGNGRLGLLFVDVGPNTSPSRPLRLRHPYSVVYIADTGDKQVRHCYLGFLELLSHEYRLDRLDVVAPPWLQDSVHDQRLAVDRAVDPHYTTISVIDAEHRKTQLLTRGEGKTMAGPELVFRFDVLPLPLRRMGALYAHSLPHALLTGDQSITDFLHFRRDQASVPFYQGVPWKQSFYTTMAHELPQKFFSSTRTSCGNLAAVNYKPNLRAFMRRNNFEVNARRLLRGVVLAAADRSGDMVAYRAAVLRARGSVAQARRNLEALVQGGASAARTPKPRTRRIRRP